MAKYIDGNKRNQDGNDSAGRPDDSANAPRPDEQEMSGDQI